MATTPLQLQEKMKVGDQILDAFTVGRLGQQLGIQGSEDLQVTAADLWASLFGDPPESAGWVTPYESGSKVKATTKVWNWLTKKSSQVAKASKGKVGPALKTLLGAALVAPLSYGAYVWMTEDDRQNARTMDAQKEAILKAAEIQDPKRQQQALDAIAGIGGTPLGTLPWIAIIGGIAVLGIFLYRRKK